MNEKEDKVLIPSYVQLFKCINSSCEDSCCAGFNITADHETFNKLHKIYDTEIEKIIYNQTKLILNEQKEIVYAKFNSEKYCPCVFFTEKKLCLIRLKGGKEYLPDFCFTYPYIYNYICGVFEASISLSCPEAARCALLNQKGIEFIKVADNFEMRSKFNKIVKIKDMEYANTPNKYFIEMRYFSISLLKNRSYALWERMILLGLFLNDVMRVYRIKKVDEIPKIITLYSEQVKNNAFKQELAGMPSSNIIQVTLLMLITSKGILQEIPYQQYLKYFNEFLAGINYSSGVPFEKVAQNYNSAYINYFMPFFKDHEYILENYIADYIFKSVFPRSIKKNVFEEYIKLVLNYSLIKMQLIGLAGFYKKLNVDITIKLIQTYTKATEYNYQSINRIINYLNDKGYNTMGYMALWIKN